MIQIPHYTPKQRGWAVRRAGVGGLVLMVIEDTRTRNVYVVEGAKVAQGLGRWNRLDLFKNTNLFLSTWDGLKFRTFIDCACKAAREGTWHVKLV